MQGWAELSFVEGAADLRVHVEERGRLCSAVLCCSVLHSRGPPIALQGTGRMHPGNMHEWQLGKPMSERWRGWAHGRRVDVLGGGKGAEGRGAGRP